MAAISSKNFILNEELRKSRRNLLIYCAIAMFVLYLSPKIIELGILSVKFEVNDHDKIKMMLLVVVVVQMIAYVCRYVVSNNVASLSELEQRRDTLLDNSKSRHGDLSLKSQLDAVKTEYKVIYPMTAKLHIVVELLYPVCLALFTVVWFAVELLPIFPRHFM